MTLFLSLGSNMGNRAALLDEAVRLIGERVGLVEAVSQYIETAPWGFVSPYPFLNACVRVITRLSPWQVLDVTQGVERELGRTRKSTDGQYHDRPIDIDLLMMRDDEGNEIVIDCERLTLPHPLMRMRDFVMVPLAEVL